MCIKVTVLHMKNGRKANVPGLSGRLCNKEVSSTSWERGCIKVTHGMHRRKQSISFPTKAPGKGLRNKLAESTHHRKTNEYDGIP